jgi:hypothetical protein
MRAKLKNWLMTLYGHQLIPDRWVRLFFWAFRLREV